MSISKSHYLLTGISEYCYYSWHKLLVTPVRVTGDTSPSYRRHRPELLATPARVTCNTNPSYSLYQSKLLVAWVKLLEIQLKLLVIFVKSIHFCVYAANNHHLVSRKSDIEFIGSTFWTSKFWFSNLILFTVRPK